LPKASALTHSPCNKLGDGTFMKVKSMSRIPLRFNL